MKKANKKTPQKQATTKQNVSFDDIISASVSNVFTTNNKVKKPLTKSSIKTTK